MSRLLAGAAAGKPFLDPSRVIGTAKLSPEGSDEWASAVLQFDNGIIAEVSCSVSVTQDNVLRVIGTEGRLDVPEFWFAGGDRAGGPGPIEVIRRDGARETLLTNDFGHLYSFEVDGAGEAIRAGRQQFDPPGMTWADTLGNLRVLDAWRADAGLQYRFETAAAAAAGRLRVPC
jgi:predicted dehydrogenase